MTYKAYDTSEFSGHPVELYFFARGTNAWRFTSAQYGFDAGYPLYFPMDGRYESAPIRRSEVAQSSERGRNTLTLTVPRDFAIAREFRGAPKAGVIALTLMRLHFNDQDSQIVTLWTGRVLSAAVTADGAQLDCEPSSASLARNGLRQLYARTCTHVLYDSLCRAVPAPFSTAISGVSGRDISVASPLPPGDLAGGWVETLAGEKQAMIVANDASTATLLMPGEFEIGEAVRFYAGCDKTTATCQTRFGNLDNYGGFPFIPNKNPFNTGVF